MDRYRAFFQHEGRRGADDEFSFVTGEPGESLEGVASRLAVFVDADDFRLDGVDVVSGLFRAVVA